MKRVLAVLAFVVGPVLYGGYAETGVAVTVGYPIGAQVYLADIGARFVGTPVFWGADLVTPLVFGSSKPGPVLVDTGFLYWPAGHLLVGHVDLELSAVLSILRTSIAAGLSVVQWSDVGYGSWRTWGNDVKIRFDLMFGAVSVGIGVSGPIDLLFRRLTQDFPVFRDPMDDLRLFSAQATASVGYWF